MRSKASSALCFLLCLLPAAAPAKDTSVPLKPGLWTGSVEIGGKIMERSQICLGDSILLPEDFLGRDRATGGPCAVFDRKVGEGSISQTTECVSLGHKVRTEMAAKVTPTHWDGVFNSKQDGKSMGTLHQTWNRAGACPADMKIGQLIAQPRR
jgi:hypothetical protein